MSSLNDQLNSFSKRMRNAPVLVKPVVGGASSGDSPSRKRPDPSEDSSPAKKPKSNIVYSQPAATGTGTSQGTQLYYAVEYIKKAEGPIAFSEVERYLSVRISPLLALMRNIDHIKINDREKTVEYVSEYNIYNAEDLLTFLRNQQTFKGVPVAKLRDGWNGCISAIEKLEERQDVIVLRTKKDNVPKYVWANTGGTIGGVDPQFTALWNSVKVPAASELPSQLEKAGFKPTSVDPATVKKQVRPEEARKQKKPHRRGKLTNTHLGTTLKDYGP